MDPQDLRREVQDEIRRILLDPDLRATKRFTAIGELGPRFGIEPFRACLRVLAQIDRSDSVSRALLEQIEAHRSWLQGRLGRDAGPSVAALDFLHEVEGTLAEPVFFDHAAGPARGATSPGRDAVSPPLDEVLALEMRRAERFGRLLALAVLAPDAARAGEDLIASACAVLRETTRDTDHAARLMPDSFALVLPCAGEPEAVKAAERIRHALCGATGVTWSAGVAACPDRPWDPDALLGAACQALDATRRAGGNAVRPHRSERREHPRRPVAPEIAAVLRDGETECPIVLLDLSIGGALLGTHRRLDAGSLVRVAIRETSARPREVLLASRVVRSEAIRAPSPEGPSWRSGIAFVADADGLCRVAGILAAVGGAGLRGGEARP